MVIGLTYPCQEYFLQYLDANRRIQLSARCPSIRKLDGSVPFRIETLTIRDKEIMLNNTSFKVDDFLLPFFTILETKNQLTQEQSQKNIKEKLTASEIMNKLISQFFNGRKEIIVRSFKAECALESVVPGGLKFMTPKLTVDHNSITSAGQFIHEDSLPIQHLVIDNWQWGLDSDVLIPFELVIVSDAKFLEIIREFETNESQWVKVLIQQSNELISRFPFFLHYYIAAPLVRHWKVQLKDVGHKCIVNFLEDNLTKLSELIDWMLRNSGLDENFGRERIYTANHISIPLTHTSNILINLLETDGRRKLEILTVWYIPELVQNQE
ncbi:hypothetical protein CAEBREN_24410 [Caenorhabditis brenneri]|uniref:DUF38 domain-containing protein n=1 Tax=Caenorhabditis brenneri TaxID=135651 RepID=G0MDM8_CAEBE|nr:hypothetical protein CAEBREN_24410 [Caenorhabditis brenneri]